MMEERIVLRNCSLVKELTEGTDLKRADLILDSGKIKKILLCGSAIEGEYQEIDLEGRTILPGLIDAHVHLHMGKEYVGMMVPTVCGRVFDCLSYAQYLLSIGITTVRDMGDDENLPTIAVRNAIKDGLVTGPRIKASGVTICPYEPGFMADPNICCFTTGASEMRRNVRMMLMNGADQIKIYGTGSMITIGSEPGQRILEEDEILEAVNIAKRKGTYVACHCHGAEAIDTMVRCGVRTIEHASFITEETCRLLDGRIDVGIVPTVGIMSDELLYDRTTEVKEHYEKIRARVFECIGNAYKNHDILIGWGTDFSLSVYKEHPYIEFKTRKEKLGFSNIDILKQITLNSAKLMEMDNVVGTVKEGKYADLIVVDGDPVKDISVMYHKPDYVIKAGKIV